MTVTYLSPTENHWACDIEADGLLEDATKIHIVCVENIMTGERHAFTNLELFTRWLAPGAVLVGHNFIAYDLVMLNRFWKTHIPVSRVVDTYILSQLYNPVYSGGHSLEAWGQRLKFPKTEHNDFSILTPQMQEYCENDTTLTRRLYLRLSERMRRVGFTERGCELEHLSWNIIQNKQRRHGFPFDKQRAEELYVTLRAREEELKHEIFKLWPPQYTVVRSFARGYKQDGTRTANYERHIQQYPELRDRPDGGYDAYDWVEFNLGSPSQRIEKLLESGWTPTSFTKVTDKGGGGNPQVDEESLLAFAEESNTPEAKALAKWIVVNSRANNIQTWLDAYDENTRAIHGSLFIASTLRYRHSNPNTANIPSVRVEEVDGEDVVLLGEEGAWTYEARDLWSCGDRDKYDLVGIDAKGIQLRILAEYVADEEFTNAILQEDPHTYNAKVWGFGEDGAARRKAKTIVYAITMGAGDARIASEAKISLAEAKAAKKLFFDRVPNLKAVIRDLQTQFRNTGRIKLCDGTPVLVPKDYRVIPYLLQGDESKIMRQASIYLDKEIRRSGIDARKVGDIHDEWQFVVACRDVETFVKLALEVFPRAGNSFGYRVPIEGSAKVGKTWADTH